MGNVGGFLTGETCDKLAGRFAIARRALGRFRWRKDLEIVGSRREQFAPPR